MGVGLLAVTERAVDAHQVVVGVDVLRVDRERLSVGGDRIREPSGEPVDQPEVVPRDPVEGKLLEHLSEIGLGVVEAPLVLGDRRAEEARLSPAGPPFLGLGERGLRVGEAPFRDLRAGAIQRPVRLARGKRGHRRPRLGRALQIRLEKEADAVVVPAQPGRIRVAPSRDRVPPSPRGRGAGGEGQCEGVGGECRHWKRRVFRAEREGRVVARELPVVGSCGQRDGALRVLRHSKAVVDHARRARPDAVVVERHADVLGLPAVHVAAVLVDHEGREAIGAAVESAVLVEHAAPEERLAPGGALERHPGLVRVSRPVGVGMADAPRTHDDFDLQRLSGRHHGELSVEHSDPAALFDREDVDGEDLVPEKIVDALFRLLVPALEGQGGVRRREEVVVQVPLLVAELVGAIRRQVAVAARLGLRRVVEGPHGAARDTRVVPGVVVVLSAQPAVGVQGRDQGHLVAGRAELGRAHDRLQERLAVQRGLHADQEPVDRAQGRVLRERERVLFGLLDHVGTVAARVLDFGDRVARHAGQALLRLPRVVREGGLRGGAHLPGEEDDGIVAAGAPLRALAADLVGHQLDALPIERVVERGEPVRGALPLAERVGMALLAVGVGGELLSVQQPLVEGLGGRGVEDGVAVDVDEAPRRLLELRDDGHRAEEDRHRAAPGEEPPELQLVAVGAPVENERDQRERHRADVREPDRAVVQRGAAEGHEDARRHADDRERDDGDARVLGALVPGPDHPLRVRDREHEERDGDEDAERQVQQEHRVKERGVAGEGRDENRVGGDQPERHEEQPVQAPLPGPQNAGGPGSGGRHRAVLMGSGLHFSDFRPRLSSRVSEIRKMKT